MRLFVEGVLIFLTLIGMVSLCALFVGALLWVASELGEREQRRAIRELPEPPVAEWAREMALAPVEPDGSDWHA